MRLATLQFETKLQKRIRMEITIFKIFIWGGISSIYMVGNHVLRPPNENFDIGYPLIQSWPVRLVLFV